MMQSLLPAIYPILKQNFGLSFSQIGLITLVNQITASLLQPVIGFYTDRRPQPYSLATGMAFTLGGMILLAFGVNFGLIVLASALIGLGSAVFHPESSRIARLASGGRHGFAQAFFQVGGNCRLSPRPAPRRVLRTAARPAQHCVVLADGAPGYRVSVDRRELVQDPWGNHDTAARRTCLNPWTNIPPNLRGADAAARAAVLEICLPRKLRQLLHVLSDRSLSALGPERPDSSFSVSWRGCGRDDARGSDWGSDWKATGHSVVDTWRAAIFARAPLRRPVMDASFCRS